MTKSDSRNLLNLYNDHKFEKIYSLKEDDNKLQESDSLEWCPTRSENVQNPPVVAGLGVHKESSVSANGENESQNKSNPNSTEQPPEELPALRLWTGRKATFEWP